ncbi:hypothetical protein BGY98DRAFT_1046697, partial [Russula aff. rugulosa BPL654]
MLLRGFCWLGYGGSRDMQRTSDQWRLIFLGSCDLQAPRCSLLILGNRLVQLLGQVAVTTGISFACANSISTATTIGTNY